MKSQHQGKLQYSVVHAVFGNEPRVDGHLRLRQPHRSLDGLKHRPVDRARRVGARESFGKGLLEVRHTIKGNVAFSPNPRRAEGRRRRWLRWRPEREVQGGAVKPRVVAKRAGGRGISS
jgi:hypothetical protein